MTACTNNGGKARRVVTAALVGVLSVGAVPAIALATTGDVALQSVTATDALEGGELTGAVDIDNNPIEIPATGEISFSADGRPQAAIPTEITVAKGASTEKIELNDFQYTITYYRANQNFVKSSKTYAGQSNEGAAPYAVGKYVTELTLTSGDYKDAVIDVPFEIKAASLDGLTVVDMVDGSLEFDGTNQLGNLAVKMGDKLLDVDQYFNVKGISYKKGDSVNATHTTDVTNAGDYAIVLIGKDGTIYAGAEAEVQFKITPLDLSKATIAADDVLTGAMSSTPNFEPDITVNGKWNAGLDNEVESVFKNGPRDSSLVWHRGEYTYTAQAQTDSGNVVNSKDFTFVATDSDLVYFHYQGGAFPTSLSINLGNGESFTADKIQAFKADASELNDGEFSVTVKNLLTGADATVADVNTPGSWLVTAKVNASAMDYTLGGSDSITVTTIAGEIETSANVYFLQNGKIVSGTASAEYTGEDQLDNIEVVVTDTYGNVLTAGEDYDVTVTDTAGNKLDEVVDAGTYKITVTSSAYNIVVDDATGAELTLQVDPVSVYDVRVARDAFQVYGKDAFIPYTGSAIEPAIEYKDSEGNWKTLPAGLYNLTFAYSEDYSGTYSKVDDMVEEGYYKIYLHAVRDNDPNWGLKNDSNKGFWDVDGYEAGHKIVRVTASRLFPDVPTDEWYSQSVYDAVNLGYMNGDGATKLFNPARPLTRAEAVCILFNMAGGNDLYKDGMFEYDADHGFETGYTDVDGTQFYAKAAAWAELTGIVNGYADGTFGVSRYVTNEEFACMLANFAKAKGEDVSVEDADAVLAGYPDAELVSDWAKESVAWAVQEGVMGNGSAISPAGSILRMRVAAMVVNYQPEGAFDSVFEFESQEQGE